MNTYPKTKPAPAGYTGLSVEELERRERAAYAEGAEAMRAKLRHHAERSGLIMLPGLDAFLRDMPLPDGGGAWYLFDGHTVWATLPPKPKMDKP